jgi:hypothetical protein
VAQAVSWLSVGNPLGQSYRARLPLHYEWVIEPDRRHGKWVDEANVGLRPLTRYWINLYRSYDYIGRALWREDPCDEEVTSDAWHSPADPRGGGVILRERCIGGGGHTGYWRLPIVIEELSTLLRCPPVHARVIDRLTRGRPLVRSQYRPARVEGGLPTGHPRPRRPIRAVSRPG